MNEQDRLRAEGATAFVRRENGQVVAAGYVAAPGDIFAQRAVTIAQAVSAEVSLAQGTAAIKFAGFDPAFLPPQMTRAFVYYIVNTRTGNEHILEGTWVRTLRGRQVFATYELRFGRLDGISGATGGLVVWGGVLLGWVLPAGLNWHLGT